MDPESARLVRDSIAALRSDKRTIVICTHNLSEAEELADQIAIIRRGKIIMQGSPGNLMQGPNGKVEYQLNLGCALNGLPHFPAGVEITAQGSDWVRYATSAPAIHNPTILRYFLDQALPVTSLQEVKRSLEDVYLQAIAAPEGEVSHVA